MEELSALADEEGEQVEEEKEKTPRAEASSRGENSGKTAKEDLDFGMEEFEEAAIESNIGEDESDSDSLEELLDQLSDGN